jgi:hypothetical protein
MLMEFDELDVSSQRGVEMMMMIWNLDERERDSFCSEFVFEDGW